MKNLLNIKKRIIIMLCLAFAFLGAQSASAFSLVPSGCTGKAENCGLCQMLQVVISVGELIMGFVGSLVLLFFIYGGFILLLSGGRSDEVRKGKTILINSTIGFIIVISAYLIVATIVFVVTGGWDWKLALPC